MRDAFRSGVSGLARIMPVSMPSYQNYLFWNRAFKHSFQSAGRGIFCFNSFVPLLMLASDRFASSLARSRACQKHHTPASSNEYQSKRKLIEYGGGSPDNLTSHAPTTAAPRACARNRHSLRLQQFLVPMVGFGRTTSCRTR